MDTEAQKQFVIALNYLLEKEGRGAQTRLARSTSIDRGFLNAIVKGRSPGPQEKKEKIAKHFGLHYENMLSIGRCIIKGEDPENLEKIIHGNKVSMGNETKSNTTTHPTAIPVVSWVHAGCWTDVVDNFQPGDADEWLNPTVNVSENAFALRVSGDSMKPEFLPGETIIVDPEVLPETGKYVVAKIENGNGGENGEATFKQFIRDGSQVFLKPLNDQYPLIDMTGKKFRIVGCVVEKRKEY